MNLPNLVKAVLGRRVIISTGIILFLACLIVYQQNELSLFASRFTSRLPFSIVATSPSKKYAFATFLDSPRKKSANDTLEDWSDDGYFLGARHHTYSLLHHPQTRSATHIPVVVLVTPTVSAAKQARLRADGATVIQSESIPLPSWIKPGNSRWKEVLTKLRLFLYTEYDKICFIDADHLITAPLDGVFVDPSTDTFQTFQNADAIKGDEPALPPSYMFASRPDTMTGRHGQPPAERDYLNAGFYVFQPSKVLFDYYIGVLQIEKRFNGGYPEQNLFNYAHRRNGNMPWKSLHWMWNINHALTKDYEAGVRSFHGKFWDTGRKQNPVFLKEWQERMAALKAFYEE